jgi:hypothetical protein
MNIVAALIAVPIVLGYLLFMAILWVGAAGFIFARNLSQTRKVKNPWDTKKTGGSRN